MTDELISFLRARFDDDERIARHASGRDEDPRSCGEHWRWEHRHDDSPVDLDEWGDYIGINGPDFAPSVGLRSVEQYPTESVGPLPHFAVSQTDGQEVRTARHIARHDPARVLAEVQSKRVIVDAYDPRFSDEEPWLFVLRCLATVYARHPDYREEWRT